MYKYLGVTFYRNGNITKNITDFTSKAKMAISSIWPMFSKFRVPLCDNQFKLFDSVVRAVLTYAAEI